MRLLVALTLSTLCSCVAYSQKNYSENLAVVRPTYSMDSLNLDSSTDEDLSVEPTQYDNAKVDSSEKLLADAYLKYQFAQGYRIQIYQGKSEAQAESVRAKVAELEGFEREAVYLNYRSPNFRVKVGNYTDRLEAYRAYQKIKEFFPSALLVQEKKVELKP